MRRGEIPEPDEGGDPACWLHVFEDDEGSDDAGDEAGSDAGNEADDGGGQGPGDGAGAPPVGGAGRQSG